MMTARAHEDASFGGPGKAFLKALRTMGASMVDLATISIQSPEGPRQISLQTDTGKFMHEVREGLRLEQWRRLSLRRESFQGLELSLDRTSTDALKGRLRGLEAYRLRTIQAGAIATLQRCHRAKWCDSAACPHCGALETTVHILDECEHYAPIRYKEITRHDWHRLPPCLRIHGLMPQHQSFPVLPVDSLERAGLAGTVQYTLLDILAERQLHMPATMVPLPRWRVEQPSAAS